MPGLLGEYECKLDTKSRIAFPSALKKQLAPAAEERFVINRGFERHLVLYPFNEWSRISDEINRLNFYSAQNRKFARYFFRGASELKLDGHSRLLLPKRLLQYAHIQDSLVLFAYADRIEVWATELYYQELEDEPEDFQALAEQIMCKRSDGEE